MGSLDRLLLSAAMVLTSTYGAQDTTPPSTPSTLQVRDLIDIHSDYDLKKISESFKAGLNIGKDLADVQESTLYDDLANPWSRLGYAMSLAEKVYGFDMLATDEAQDYELEFDSSEKIYDICQKLVTGCIWPIDETLGPNSQMIYIADDLNTFETTLIHELAGHLAQMVLKHFEKMEELVVEDSYYIDDSNANFDPELKFMSILKRPSLFIESFEIVSVSGDYYKIDISNSDEFFALYLESLTATNFGQPLVLNNDFENAPVFSKYFGGLLLNMASNGSYKDLFQIYLKDPHLMFMTIGQNMPEGYIYEFVDLDVDSNQQLSELQMLVRGATANYLKVIDQGGKLNEAELNSFNYIVGLIAFLEMDQSITKSSGASPIITRVIEG